MNLPALLYFLIFTTIVTFISWNKRQKTLLKQLKAISWVTALMLLIGRFYTMKTPYVQENKSKVALEPWKNRFWIYGVLMGLMVGLYFIFS